MKLIWEMTGEQFGSRQALYETFYAADPIVNRVRLFSAPQLEEARDLARRAIDLSMGSSA